MQLLGSAEGKADILQLVSYWLANPDNGPWLLILDNADDATVLLDPSTNDGGICATLVQRCLRDFLPRVQHGAVLITTRDRTCALELIGHHGTPVEVQSMSPNESVQLLRNILPDAVKEEASELVKELNKIPLAISQASAYIKSVSLISIPKYLGMFRRSNEDQAALLNKDRGDLRRDRGVPNAVITSWELSFSQIRDKTPESADLLSLMSFFNRQGIPRSLIQGDIDEISFYEAINPLLSFSLIRKETAEDTFEMHRLVQTAMRHWLRSNEGDQLWKGRAIKRVAQQFPVEDQDQHWPVCETLLSHADEVILHSATSRESQLHRADLLVCTARYLIERKGHDELAEQRSTQALRVQRQYFDDKSDEILTTMDTLAYAKMVLSKTEDATILEEYVLETRLDQWGPEDNKTLIVMHNLALLYSRLGRYEKAEDLLERVVKARERLLSPSHVKSLVPRDALASVQYHQGKYEEAAKLPEQILEISTRCFGLEHTGTLSAMCDLSETYSKQDKLEEAENLIAQAIPLFTNVFGPSNCLTLNAKKVLAETYYNQNKLDEAKEICMSCLPMAQELHGLRHDTTFTIKALLGLIYRGQGEYVDASRILKEVMESTKQLMGAEHPTTLIDMHNLSLCYYDMGDKDQAIQLMTEVLCKRRERLNASHPFIADSEAHLAHWKRMKAKSDGLEVEDTGSEEQESEKVEEEEESEEEESEKEETMDYESLREQIAENRTSSPATPEMISGQQSRKQRRLDS